MRQVIVTLAMACAAPALAETLTADQVVALSSAGIGDDAIIAKIRSSGTRFDLSADEMVGLKKRGVSGPVIAAMLGSGSTGGTTMSLSSPNPMDPHPAGVYLLEDWASTPTMSRIDPTMSSQAKTGGIWGYALTGGIASMSVKVAIANPTAHTHSASRKPVFFFFFDESNPSQAQTGAFLAGVVTNATSPNEFTLVHLVAKDGRREARVGSMNIGGAKTGVMDKDRIAFDYQMVRPGVYRVSPNDALPSGEYGFVHTVSGSMGAGGVAARIFDFSAG